MDFDLDDMQRMLLDGAEKLMKPRISVELWRRRKEGATGFDAAAWAQFADLGWLALPMAEEAGGLGGSMIDVALLMTALGRGLAVDPYVSTAIVGAHILARPDGGFADLLGRVAGGDARLALAHGEAATGYDLGADRDSRARAEGGGYRLDGAKTLVRDAPSATHLIVSAMRDGEMALLLVPADAAGVTLDGYPLIDGSRGADVTLARVAVGADALIASGAAAVALIEAASDRATLAYVAMAVGAMEACLDLCSEYLKERRQFGQPIGTFQALQHMIVTMLVSTNQARSALYAGLAAIDAEPARRAHAVSAAKLVANDAMQLVSRTGVQLFGGFGVTDEYAISHYYRALIVLEKLNGDTAFHLDRMARSAPDSAYDFYGS